jgi:nucleotide-binding universal stress UspA family protein
MLDLHRILFPTDFSECAQGALPHAIRLAELHDADLELLHVLVLHATSAIEAIEPFPGEESAKEALEATAREPKGGRVTHHVTRAIAAAPAILDYADAGEVDLIVIGSHGRRGIRRLLLGSVAEEVLREARCPVLIVREKKEPATEVEVKRILIPVDFSKQTALAVGYAHELAGTFGAALDLLHVVEVPTYPDFYVPFSAALETTAVRRDAGDRLEALAEPLRATHEVGTHVKVGRTTTEVTDFAERGGHDLIVLPSHGYSGLERVLLGSVAEGVLRRTPCPVLTVKPFGVDLRPSPSAAGAGAASTT